MIAATTNSPNSKEAMRGITKHSSIIYIAAKCPQHPQNTNNNTQALTFELAHNLLSVTTALTCVVSVSWLWSSCSDEINLHTAGTKRWMCGLRATRRLRQHAKVCSTGFSAVLSTLKLCTVTPRGIVKLDSKSGRIAGRWVSKESAVVIAEKKSDHRDDE